MVVLPDCLFVQTTRTKEQMQDEDILRRWVDPHRLKKIDGKWTKEGKEVITGKVEDR